MHLGLGGGSPQGREVEGAIRKAARAPTKVFWHAIRRHSFLKTLTDIRQVQLRGRSKQKTETLFMCVSFANETKFQSTFTATALLGRRAWLPPENDRCSCLRTFSSGWILLVQSCSRRVRNVEKQAALERKFTGTLSMSLNLKSAGV